MKQCAGDVEGPRRRRNATGVRKALSLARASGSICGRVYRGDMLIGVISDTHDRMPMIDAGLELFARRGVQAVVHPGDFVAPFAMRRLVRIDLPLYATYGNNDGERKGLQAVHPSLQDGPLFVELAGRSVLVHHFIDWCAAEDIARADIVITGHSHEVVNRVESGRLFLNPGECCGWVTGRCTVAILDTAGPSAEICELDAQ